MASLRRLTSLFLTGFSIATIGLARADDPGSNGTAGSKPAQAKARPVNFAREVSSILSDNCFACHGPDDKQSKAGLRLDTKEGRSAGQAQIRQRGGHSREGR